MDLEAPPGAGPRRVMTDATGVFRFLDVTPGPVHLTASARRCTATTLDLVVETATELPVAVDLGPGE